MNLSSTPCPTTLTTTNNYQRMKKPDSLAGLFVSYLITRKIDMMGLIYGQSATGSSGVYKDLLLIEDLGGVDDCGLFDLFEALVDSTSPVTAGALW